MGTDDFYKIIGRVTVSLSRIDFLLSNIAVDVKLVPDYPEFYGKQNLKQKITELKSKINSHFNESEIADAFINNLNRLDELRQLRNQLVHAVTLQNSDEIMFYNFRTTSEGVKRNVTIVPFNDLAALDTELINLHNDLYTLRKEHFK
ncbi:hypothetical protein [Lacibacter sp.]|uniref:hypothetical protein n=1 Tax=Lacibacter sp. TaxID=1915409 RepID=UPI002B4AAE32|nr:hypothetical protein [Lacibacter sp.]HLP36685.1 hypothetical protein [Lacibacter sp.]